MGHKDPRKGDTHELNQEVMESEKLLLSYFILPYFPHFRDPHFFGVYTFILLTPVSGGRGGGGGSWGSSGGCHSRTAH